MEFGRAIKWSLTLLGPSKRAMIQVVRSRARITFSRVAIDVINWHMRVVLGRVAERQIWSLACCRTHMLGAVRCRCDACGLAPPTFFCDHAAAPLALMMIRVTCRIVRRACRTPHECSTLGARFAVMIIFALSFCNKIAARCTFQSCVKISANCTERCNDTTSNLNRRTVFPHVACPTNNVPIWARRTAVRRRSDDAVN